MEIPELIKIFGPLDGVMALAIWMIWREWRKSENRTVELLQEQIRMNVETANKYSSFENAIRGLTDVIKKG